MNIETEIFDEITGVEIPVEIEVEYTPYEPPCYSEVCPTPGSPFSIDAITSVYNLETGKEILPQLNQKTVEDLKKKAYHWFLNESLR